MKTINDIYNGLSEWIRWIVCFPLSLITAIVCSWAVLYINGFLDGDFTRIINIKVVQPSLCTAIFLIGIYLTIPRAKLAVMLAFIVLRSLILILFLVSAFITLIGFKEIVTFDNDFFLATLGEIVVLFVSVILWKEIRKIYNALND